MPTLLSVVSNRRLIIDSGTGSDERCTIYCDHCKRIRPAVGSKNWVNGFRLKLICKDCAEDLDVTVDYDPIVHR